MSITPPKTNMALENGGRKTTFLLGRSIFSGYVSFREGSRGQPGCSEWDSAWVPLVFLGWSKIDESKGT